jgi:hypothetical protein
VLGLSQIDFIHVCIVYLVQTRQVPLTASPLNTLSLPNSFLLVFRSKTL